MGFDGLLAKGSAMNPALCMHKQSFHFHLDTPEGTLYRIQCISCDLVGEWGALEEARPSFGLLAEKIKVRALMEKPPKERTLDDWVWISYSPYGTASKHGY